MCEEGACERPADRRVSLNQFKEDGYNSRKKSLDFHWKEHAHYMALKRKLLMMLL